MRTAAPVMYSASVYHEPVYYEPVYYQPVAFQESYSWRPGADSDQMHLDLGSRCIGGYRYSTDKYFTHSFFNGVSTYATKASEPPIEPPYRAGAKRWAKVENKQPKTEDPFRIEQEARPGE